MQLIFIIHNLNHFKAVAYKYLQKKKNAIKRTITHFRLRYTWIFFEKPINFAEADY